MGTEAVARFVVICSAGVVIENPPRMLCAAWLVGQLTDLFVLTVPEPAHATMRAMLLPKLEIDMTLAVERCYEFIAMARGAFRELPRAREVEPDTFEGMRQPCQSILLLTDRL